MGTALLALGGALLFPAVALVFLLWLTHLEETLDRDVRRAARKPAPPPILAVPVRRRTVETTAVRIPEQRQAPTVETSDVERVGQPVLQPAGDRSDAVSLGGSTKR
jgi:hypothetical protein